MAVTISIVQDANKALSCWSLWEALNERLGHAQFERAPECHRPTGSGVLRQSLASHDASHDVWAFFESGRFAANEDRADNLETTTPNDG